MYIWLQKGVFSHHCRWPGQDDIQPRAHRQRHPSVQPFRVRQEPATAASPYASWRGRGGGGWLVLLLPLVSLLLLGLERFPRGFRLLAAAAAATATAILSVRRAGGRRSITARPSALQRRGCSAVGGDRECGGGPRERAVLPPDLGSRQVADGVSPGAADLRRPADGPHILRAARRGMACGISRLLCERGWC
jgi:hypothetical protein